jgi:hypothetical protein
VRRLANVRSIPSLSDDRLIAVEWIFDISRRVTDPVIVFRAVKRTLRSTFGCELYAATLLAASAISVAVLGHLHDLTQVLPP